ncbi:MAG: alpha-glucan family phosphorylase [Phycisphaeraceae bacterium]|nr:alpha-glucan family phosphorylase [Phycisphaeraceae bacterium]MCW5769348.1 alpha-glucan family phosphorylase [Phycisphaeraceae bacterium]
MSSVHKDTIAYFSMEIGLRTDVPTYSGGLGILAGDSIRAAADLGLPMCAVTLLYRKGYFTQKLDEHGRQTEVPTEWSPESVLQPMEPRISVPVEGRNVFVRAFCMHIHGVGGHRVPVYFLDTDMESNSEEDRQITHNLYGGDARHRIKQETILGIGGRRMLRAIGHDVTVFHMNEGHASFLTVELLSEYICRVGRDAIDYDALSYVRPRCVFTTHTPIEAGHDRFAIEEVRRIVGDHPVFHRPDIYGEDGILNTTRLAMNLSKYSNGVAKKHGEVSRAMFPGYKIDSITNGVHAGTWASPAMRRLFDEHIPDWRRSNSELRAVLGIAPEKVWAAHQEAKRALMDRVHADSGVEMDPDVLTLGFARRVTAYKRTDLLLSDPERLASIARNIGPVQIVYAGKAHPHDGIGKSMIERVYASIGAMREHVRIAFLPNYNIELGAILTSGADVWVNLPEPPLEASGTSGMKAALNGVPSLSTADGWWIEGMIENVTGWTIGAEARIGQSRDHAADKELVYAKLEQTVVPMYYRDRARFISMMQHSIALNGSYFTTQRMMRDYALRAYFG